MAKLDAIILKTSDYSQQDLVASMKGEKTTGGSYERAEQGEIFLRYTGEGKTDPGTGELIDESPNEVELWTLNEDGTPVQVTFDLSAVLPEYDLETNLAALTLNNLSDVEYEDPTPSQVLTWDGLKWVNRDLPEFGGEGSIIPTLNEVGDVNYGFYAVDQKFGPEQGDVLFYNYNYQEQKYQWAPSRLDIDLIAGIESRGRSFVVDNVDFDNIVIGNTVVFSEGQVEFGKENGAYMAAYDDVTGAPAWRNSLTISKGAKFQLSGDIVLQTVSSDPNYTLTGIRYESIEQVPETLPDERYFTTQKHVRQNISETNLGELNNVNDTNILQGQVLGWDSLSAEYRPVSGITPDLSVASIEDLQDVSGEGRGRGRPLTYNETDGVYVSTRIKSYDIEWSYAELGSAGANDPTTGLPFTFDEDLCPACDEANLGRVSVIENIPHVCLRVRENLADANSTGTGNTTYGYTRLLLDGYNKNYDNTFSPDETRQEYEFYGRTDPLQAVAYEGSLGALTNVSTADVFPGSALVYDPAIASFRQGYPALFLPAYSIGELGDVDVSGAGRGYGLLWNGSQWEASTLEQKVRLDDLQDVQFGSLGVQNTKLVGAWMLSNSLELGATYEYNQDVSTVLAVSTQKTNYGPGTTASATWNPGQFADGAPTQGGTAFFDWRQQPAFSVAELLDLYLRWNPDESWQTIEGDGCIEIYFYPTLLLDDRTIFRKVNNTPSGGTYILQLTQAGGLRFSASGAQGGAGVSLSTAINTVSLNNWHHVAVTKERNMNRLYLDGFLVDSFEVDATWTGDGQFVIGRNDLNDNNTLSIAPFRGYMSDFRVTRGRAKYTGATYTLPASIEQEIIDTTPEAGDFLSYDGTKWTNVSGVEGDITNKSINELNDVDTATENPATGDALVWTGAKWEPGIPGLGATWSLDDMTDVETFYQSSLPTVKFSQAESLQWSTAFYANTDDGGGFYQSRPLSGQYADGQVLSWFDCSYTCDPDSPCGSDGKYQGTRSTYIKVRDQGNIEMAAQKITLYNAHSDCSFVAYDYHEPALFYSACPDRYEPNENPNPSGDIPGEPEETYIPCWGVIQDKVPYLLPYGQLGMLGNVSSAQPTLGQALAWNGAQWAPASDVAANISNNSINDLADVDTSGVYTNATLTWNGSAWVPGDQMVSITDIGDMTFVDVSDGFPVSKSSLYDPPETNVKGGDPNSGFPNGTNALLDIGEDGGYRGIVFGGDGAVGALWTGLENGDSNKHGEVTILNSPVARTGAGAASWLELSNQHIRFATEAGASSEGIRIAQNLKLIYEDDTLVWENFDAQEVAPKGLIKSYIDTGLANLDLSPNILENIGNVDTTGKGNGYALVWNADAQQWQAESSIAADISLSSIGELVDVAKVENTDLDTNDGSLSFDVGKLITTRPHQTNGGIELPNADGNARIGWSETQGGGIVLENLAATFSGGIASRVEVDPLNVLVQSTNGLRYSSLPPLVDDVIPTFGQVRQQIVKEQTDFTALFFLDGNSLFERNYGWTIETQITTTPNPAYFSQFGGEYSLHFRKINQDKIVWRTADGCPQTWSSETLYAFEMWFYVDSTSSGDDQAEILFAPAGINSSQPSGLSMGISGDKRNQLWFSTTGVSNGSSSNSIKPSASTSIFHDFSYDQWTHVVMQMEGQGRFRLYVDGLKVGETQTNQARELEGGLTIGGRQRPIANDETSYFTGFIDDFRITRGWLPYPVDQASIGRPIEPLPPGDYRSTYGTLNALEDVRVLAPSNGQVLMYNSVEEIWEPGPADAISYDISGNIISDLSDVDDQNQSAADDDVLRWNTVTDKWERSRVDGNGGVRPINARSASPGVLPQAGTLFAGEIFINMADKRAYSLDSSGQPFAFAIASDIDGIIDQIDTTFDRVVGGTF